MADTAVLPARLAPGELVGGGHAGAQARTGTCRPATPARAPRPRQGPGAEFPLDGWRTGPAPGGAQVPPGLPGPQGVHPPREPLTVPGHRRTLLDHGRGGHAATDTEQGPMR